jgi:hypothetical protein
MRILPRKKRLLRLSNADRAVVLANSGAPQSLGAANGGS